VNGDDDDVGKNEGENDGWGNDGADVEGTYGGNEDEDKDVDEDTDSERDDDDVDEDEDRNGDVNDEDEGEAAAAVGDDDNVGKNSDDASKVDGENELAFFCFLACPDAFPASC
jgi:hypothetical protein